MSAVDYYGIEEQIKSVLLTFPALSGTHVMIEEEIAINRGNLVGIYLEDRVAPIEEQSLSAGQRTRFHVRFSLWCWHFGFGKDRSIAMRARDVLVGNVELALMSNKTLNDSVSMSWLDGGEFISGPDPTGKQFMAGAQVVLTVDATASV